MSNLPGCRTADSSTVHAASARPAAPSAADTQNMVCQSAYWTMRAASGRPSAAPMPTVELIRATAETVRSGGSTSRRMLIDRGTTAAAAPWSARAAISTRMSEVSAHSTDPAVISERARSSTRFLPYMSPARPSTGVSTAPARSVAVTVHDTAAAEDPVSRGRSGSSGTTAVCITAIRMPPYARTGTVSPARNPAGEVDRPARVGSVGIDSVGVGSCMALPRARDMAW